MATDIFVSDYRFNRLADAIADLPPCPFYGRVTTDQIKHVLGVVGDVWPISIAAHMIRDAVEDANKSSLGGIQA